MTITHKDEYFPWILKDLKILVDSKIQGYENIPSDLHDYQIWNIMEIAQRRITPSTFNPQAPKPYPKHSIDFHPFIELHKYLDLFCVSYKLEVLYAQAIHLIKTRWSTNIKIYFDRTNGFLIIRYWIKEPYTTVYLIRLEVNETESEFNGDLFVKSYSKCLGSKINLVLKTRVLKNVELFSFTECSFDGIGSVINTDLLDIELLIFKIAKENAAKVLSDIYQILVSYPNYKSSVIGRFTSFDVESSSYINPFDLNNDKTDKCLVIKYHPKRCARCTIDLQTGRINLSESLGNTDYLDQVEDKINSNINSLVNEFISLRCQVFKTNKDCCRSNKDNVIVHGI